MLRNIGGSAGSSGGVGLSLQRLVKVGYGVSLIATIPLLLLPLQSTFGPWMAAAVPAGKGRRISKHFRDSLLIATILCKCCLPMITPSKSANLETEEFRSPNSLKYALFG